jgi:hypothetical protein
MNNSWAFSVRETSDGGFIVAGGVDVEAPAGSEAVIVRTDSEGTLIWQKVIGGPGDDYLRTIITSPDGGYIVAGSTETGQIHADAGISDAWLFKMDPNGTILWNRTFGGDADDWASAVHELPDGSFVIAGGTRSTGSGGADAWVFKVDSDGQQIWSRTFGSVNADWANSIDVSKNGEILIAGLTSVLGVGKTSPLVVALDSEGREIWRKNIVESGNGWANAVLWCSSGGFVVAGTQIDEQPTYKTPVPSGVSKLSEHGDLIANQSMPIMNIYGSVMLTKFITGSIVLPTDNSTWWDDDATDGAVWHHRIPVTLHETKNVTRVKEPVVLRLSEIFGKNVSSSAINPDSIRVIDPTAIAQAYADPRSIGIVPYRIDDVDGDGVYSGRDILSFLSQTLSGGTKTYNIYVSEERNISKPLYPVIPYNLIQNPGFELGSGSEPYYWVGEHARCVRLDDRAHSGTYRLVVETTDAAQQQTLEIPGGDAAATIVPLRTVETVNLSLFGNTDQASKEYPGARSSWVEVSPQGMWESVTMSGWSMVENMSGEQGTVTLKVRLEYADLTGISGSVLLDQQPGGWMPFSITITPDRPVTRAYIQLEFINVTGTVSLDDILLYRDAYRVDIGDREDWTTSQVPYSSSRESGPAIVTSTSTIKVVYLPDSEIFSVPGFEIAIAALALALVSVIMSRRRP